MAHDPRPKAWPWYPDGEELGTIIKRADDASVGLYAFIRYPQNSRRVYDTDERGRATGGALYRYSFELKLICGETRASWLVGYSIDCADKIPKRPTELKMRLYGLEEVEEMIWVHNYRREIVQAVEGVTDQFTLAKIGALAGWKPTAPTPVQTAGDR